jgi:hypothetical protein
LARFSQLQYALPTWASLRLIIGIFRWHLPSAISYKYCCFIGLSFPTLEAIHTPCNPAQTSLYWTKHLVALAKRIAFIFIQPTEKDEIYITSLHNEVVGPNSAKECMELS